MSELKEGVNKKGFGEVVRNIVIYGECWKNHGVAQETSIADGCTEFIAAGDSLFCDACGCHRSFHKKKVVMEEGDGHDGSFSSSPTTNNTNTSASAIYEACCKNQSMKRYPTKDGCLEFLPREGAEAGSRAALRCDACNCHRNFHKRREQEQQPVRKRSSYTRYDSNDY